MCVLFVSCFYFLVTTNSLAFILRTAILQERLRFLVRRRCCWKWFEAGGNRILLGAGGGPLVLPVVRYTAAAGGCCLPHPHRSIRL